MLPKRFLYTLLLTPLCLLAAPPAADLPEGVEHVRTLEGIEEYRLTANDLRVLLAASEGLPVATVMVTYEVGSRNEAIGTTGATHILEHMMFKGTPRFNTEQGNDYSTQMERIGARANATTWFDRTNYFATVPSEYVPMTIELEADRMRNLLIQEEDLASEMTVVRNEYERGENSPVMTLIKEMFAAAFMAHPYGHPTIGWRSDIESTNPDKLRRFYDTYYWPENAVLSVVGGFDRAHTLAAVVEHYGKIERAPRPIPAVTTEEPPQIGPRRVEVNRAGQVGVVITGYKVPEATHPDWPALILIDQILGADKTGRLYRALEDKGKASGTFTFAPRLRDPGLFFFGAYLTPEATHAEAEAVILDEITRLIGGGVTEDELTRAKAVIEAGTVYGRDGPYAVADQLNDAIAIGDWTNYVTLPEAIQSVTREQVREVAERYFRERSRTTGWFVPEVKNSLQATGGGPGGPLYFRDPAIYGPSWQGEAGAASGAGPSGVNFSDGMQRAQVGEIELVAIDMPVEGVVSFVGSIAAGELLSPDEKPVVAGMTAAMLDKGTAQRDRFAVAELLDALGAEIGFSSGPHSLTFSGKFLQADAGPVLDLLAEQLREPAFDPEVFTTVKARTGANLLRAIDDTDYRAETALARQLYPPDHPNYSLELDRLLAAVEATTVEDLAAFHREFYGPRSMRLIFAGDIDFEQLKAAVAVAFEGWTGGHDYPTDHPEARPAESATTRIQIADKPSVSVNFGYPTGLQRTDPDYLPFMVGNYLLGGSFNSRLMQEIRKERGLTYSIYSTHTGDILTPGHWKLGVTFAPEMLAEGLAATRQVVADWHRTEFDPEEVAAAIETLTGSYLVGLSTTMRVAGQAHSFMQRGYPADFIDTYPEKLLEIDAAAVTAAVRRYFDPEALRCVIAGSLQAAGPVAASADGRRITVRLDAPSPAWTLEIDAVYETDSALLVLSRLSEQTDGMAAQVITTLTDSVRLPEGTPDLPVEHFIVGKTWNWGDESAHTFIQNETDIEARLEGAEPLELTGLN